MCVYCEDCGDEACEWLDEDTYSCLHEIFEPFTCRDCKDGKKCDDCAKNALQELIEYERDVGFR